MKKTYIAPKLTSFGNVAQMTQVVGNISTEDFVYLNGQIISNSNDVDSLDLICTGSLSNMNCTGQ